MGLGLVVAAGLVVAMQVPLLHQRAQMQSRLATLVEPIDHVPALAWPSIGSAALDIPSLGVVLGHNDAVVPIASLTKMMTAYVTLQKFPLTTGSTGPCTTVSASDVANYVQESALHESSALVVAGEQLCEIDLLEGLLVHSAGNYADLLATMVAGSSTTFVSLMNQTAASLGLRSTSYADASGFSALSVSSALDQAKLAVILMQSPLVRSIVDQTHVTLPVAGDVASFTPLVGVDNVIGVKSGRTDEAGGCDVMAMTFQQGGLTRVLYAVVLGQRGGDLLGPAGRAALALSLSALANRLQVSFAAGEIVGHVGWGSRRVAFGFRASSHVTWWAARTRPTFALHLRPLTSTIRRGEVVGWVSVNGGARRLALIAQGRLAPPTLWQRLR